ncbi:MAG: XdhC family protein [Lachnospiraceae bacterium]|nr:XdhC family protein [Lachnospiraceae bacterium]
MNGYYKALKSCDPNEETITLTVINGDAAGEKAVISGEKPVYYSKENGFLKLHEKELCSLSGSGIVTVDGFQIYHEKLGHEKKLVICGCGHVSIPVIRLAKMVGFKVTAIDDRPEFADKAKEAGADLVISGTFKKALGSIDGDPFTYYVIVTRGHRWDEECLFEICGKKHAYIGMMGSKRRIAMAKESLLNEGIDRSIIDSLHSPIGLEIGSETPEEIAVSVMAEIIQVKNMNPDHPIPEDILAAINRQETEEASEETEGTHTASGENGSLNTVNRKMILATIIRREGSAPREAGAKMLFTGDSAINTIGGGLLEARAKKKALEMIEKGAQKPEILHLELTADAAATEGEVCGGRVDILLEPV